MRGLTIDATSWHAKAYFWALGIWFKFKGLDDWELKSARYEGNLCLYVRTLVVWLPLVLLLHIAFLGLVVLTLVKLPIALFGATVFGWAVGILCIGSALAWGAVRLSDFYAEKRRSNLVRPPQSKPRKPAKVGPAVEGVVEKGLSFFEVVFEWMAAQKKKICPKITFVAKKVA